MSSGSEVEITIQEVSSGLECAESVQLPSELWPIVTWISSTPADSTWLTTDL